MATKTKSSSTSASRSASKAQTPASCKAGDPASVQHRAWEIWKERGCPQGTDMENWLQAEKELSSRKR